MMLYIDHGTSQVQEPRTNGGPHGPRPHPRFKECWSWRQILFIFLCLGQGVSIVDRRPTPAPTKAPVSIFFIVLPFFCRRRWDTLK